MRFNLHRPSPALVVACLALLLVLGGTGIAAVASVPNNSVGTAQLRNNAVTAPKIASNAVTSAKIPSNAVTASKIAANAVTNAKIANGAVNNAKLASNAVTNSRIANDAVTSSKVQNQSLLAEDFAPGQLPRGPQGPQGPPGPRGPTGTVGKLVLRTNSVTVGKSNSSEVRVSCNSGEQAVSGGATWQNRGDFNQTLVYSAPIYDTSAGRATGWVARGRNQTTGDQTFIVQVLCGNR